jgi:hypothetical protein
MTPERTELLATVARRKGLHPRILRRWIDKGIVAGYRFGPRQLRVDPAEIDNLLTPVDAK